MDDSKILDWDVLSAMGLFPELGEEIIWAGSPDVSTQIPGLNAGVDYFGLWLSYYGAIGVSVVQGFQHENIWFVLVPSFIVVLVQVLPAVVSYQRVHKTHYIVTNKRIIFNLWTFLGSRVHWMRYEDFQKTNLLMHNFDAHTGTIYLMTGKEVGFWTYDFETGERRHHPSLECVRNPVDLAKKIEAERLKNL